MGFSEAPQVSSKLAGRLGRLHGASDGAIEAAISLWPLDDRRHLAACGIIDYNFGEDAADYGRPIGWEDVETAANRGEPTDFGLTDRGRRVIADCAV